jgi:hypothetical protein
MIAIESVLFLLGGIVLAVILIQLFGRGGEATRGRPATVRLVRQTQAPDGHEETRLTINDQVILTASSAGLRLADYADEVARLEAIATRIASALGGSVELARVGAKSAELVENGVPVRGLLTGDHSR